MIRDIIWDFDGTLFNTYPGIINSFKKALQDSGINESNENILNNFKISEGHAITYFKELYGLDTTFVDRFLIYKSALKPEMSKPFPFAAEICRQFTDLGGRNYIITHRGSSTIDYLKHYGMLCYFTEVVTKDNGFKRKPDPEAFIYIIEKYKLNKNKTMVVGDRACEILGGQAAGIKTCLYNTNNILLTVEPDYTIGSLKDLLQTIAQ